MRNQTIERDRHDIELRMQATDKTIERIESIQEYQHRGQDRMWKVMVAGFSLLLTVMLAGSGLATYLHGDTKAGQAELKADMSRQFEKVDRELAEMRAEQAEMKAEIAGIKTDLAEIKRLLKRGR